MSVPFPVDTGKTRGKTNFSFPCFNGKSFQRKKSCCIDVMKKKLCFTRPIGKTIGNLESFHGVTLTEGIILSLVTPKERKLLDSNT